MRKGIFITIEGPDGSGKSTQIENIKEFFKEKNIEIVFTREPGGTMCGEQIRKILLDKELVNMSPMTEAFLFAAQRAQNVYEVIKPAVDSGKIVIGDRFIDSSIAYQGYGRDLGDAVEIVNSYAVNEYMPDLTFLLKLDPEIGINRSKKRDELDRLENEKLSFHKKVYEGYLKLEEKYPDRIFAIDASKSIDEVKKAIYDKLEEVLRKNEF